MSSAIRRLALALALCAAIAPALAGSIEPASGSLSLNDDSSYQLTAAFAVDLGPHLEEAVSRGVPLYFNLEFELVRPRWYWLNERVAEANIVHRLSYNALTRQYRLSTGALHQNFASFADALNVLSHVLLLHVVDKNALKSGETYNASLRLSLDQTQLPKPFQVESIASRDWQVDTKLLRWQFIPLDKNNFGHVVK
jgi:hypothetical protein